ncbi:predicted GPI-anchored protein 58 [Schistocerca piceifrons]|uniref:predicted GPI-anchored protein 58 n=1 Tax=Schistocerca piceifrons TaxID=274613 RepID=UPI001F5E8B17|nr:predicted GPI-anchored protein 58 [Schistocerca piceifrons]
MASEQDVYDARAVAAAAAAAPELSDRRSAAPAPSAGPIGRSTYDDPATPGGPRTSRSDGQQQRRRAAPPPAPPATPPRQPAQRRLLAARADLGYADVLQGRTTPPSAPAVQPLRRSEDGPAPPAAAADFIAVLQEVQATLVAVSAALAQLPTAITAAVHAALRSFPTATAIASAGHGSQP